MVRNMVTLCFLFHTFTIHNDSQVFRNKILKNGLYNVVADIRNDDV
jgi:hypothetical protein